jgi:hypothetical protein
MESGRSEVYGTHTTLYCCAARSQHKELSHQNPDLLTIAGKYSLVETSLYNLLVGSEP